MDTNSRNTQSIVRAGWLTLGGGALMASLWLIFTASHGPTSYNQDNIVLGGGMHFWGMLLGGLPGLALAGGLIMLRPELVQTGNRRSSIGWGLTLFGLVIPALLDLAIRALGAPFFLPVLGAGLLVLAGTHTEHSTLPRQIFGWLRVIGWLLVVAFLFALIPQEIQDAYRGYRIFGTLAYFLPGLLWIRLGVALVRGSVQADI